MKKILKSKINKRILISITKIALVSFSLFVLVSLTGTFAYFSDTESTQVNLSAGVWIPTLEMSVSPSSPDGINNWYKTSPCITLNASGITVGSSIIYYEFSNDGDPINGGIIYNGGCIAVPDGNPTYFQAQAVNTLNPNWKSNIVNGDFKVDTKCPYVQITSPSESDMLSGTVPIRGTVADLNPHHYWLVIENSSGTKVAGPGTVNDTSSFTDKKFFDWDTTAVPNGIYTIKLEARDEFGNKCPNQAPVLSDPENPNDSVDWITVSVDNTTEEFSEEPEVRAGDVVINEVMWMGSTQSSADEWIELKNTTSKTIDIGGWKIENAFSSGGTLVIPSGKSISPNGFFLISNYSEDSSNSALNIVPDLVDSGLSLSDSGNGNLVLKNSDGDIIDEAKGDFWPVGTNGTLKQSMERNDVPGDGTLASSWHTCEDEHCNDTIYWDVEGNNYGTPKAPNLSDNDPTSIKNDKATTINLENDLEKAGEPEKSQSEELKELPEQDNQEEVENNSKPEDSIEVSEENENEEVAEEKNEELTLLRQNENQRKDESPQDLTN